MNGEVNPSAISIIPGLLKKKAGRDEPAFKIFEKIDCFLTV